MNRRDKKFLIFGACIAILLIGFWVFQIQIDENGRGEGGLSGVQKLESSLPEEVDGFVRPEGLPDEAWNAAVSSHNIRKSANRVINFYGKIVDQHGDPVPEVEVLVKIWGYETSFLQYATTGSTQTKELQRLLTNVNGEFSIEKRKGTSIRIEEINKEGYIRPNRGINYSYTFNNLASGPYANIYHQPDKANPVVFPMWKKGEAEPLIRTGAKLNIEPAKGVDVVYYSFSLGAKPTSTPPEDWDIKASGWLKYPESRYDDKMWEVTLTAPEGGGFIITEDLHTNLAPEEGYINSLTFKSTDLSSEDLRRTIYYRAYYKNADGSKYAAFRFRFGFTGRNGEGRFSVRLENLRINPNGSRNLEFDPRKEIREYP